MAMHGRIIQPISGIYHVATERGIISCRARGIFRKKNIIPLAGDYASITLLGEGEGVIDEILPRRNSFIRPNVANIDVICYVISARFPEPNELLLDKMTVLAAFKNVEIVLILNKTDLDEDQSARRLLGQYRKLGYTVFETCALQNESRAALLEHLQNKTVIFSGNTGVGKSSLLNTLSPGIEAKVSEISEKLGRGRHTTREITLYAAENGMLLGDTPGFGNIDLTLEPDLTPERLPHCFPEFRPWITQCQFADCTHTGEYGCMLAQKAAAHEILPTRYQSYLQLYKQITALQRKRYQK